MARAPRQEWLGDSDSEGGEQEGELEELEDAEYESSDSSDSDAE